MDKRNLKHPGPNIIEEITLSPISDKISAGMCKECKTVYYVKR